MILRQIYNSIVYVFFQPRGVNEATLRPMQDTAPVAVPEATPEAAIDPEPEAILEVLLCIMIT